MAQPLDIPPTKSALLRLKAQVEFLEQGHELLERKQQLLTWLIHDRLKEYRRLRGQAQKALEQAYRSLSFTYLRTDYRALYHAAMGRAPAIQVQILSRSNMGVEYPSVQVSRQQPEPVSLFGTESSLDETRRRMAELTELLARLGEAETILRRLLIEQRRTQKRVNSLKYKILPRYHQQIRTIQGRLEEEERDTLFQIKVLREQGSAST